MRFRFRRTRRAAPTGGGRRARVRDGSAPSAQFDGGPASDSGRPTATPSRSNARSPRMLTRCIRGLAFAGGAWGSVPDRLSSEGFSVPLQALRSRPFGAASCDSRIRLVLPLVLRSRTQACPVRGRGRGQRPLDRLGRAELPPSTCPTASRRPGDERVEDRFARPSDLRISVGRPVVKAFVIRSVQRGCPGSHRAAATSASIRTATA